MTTEPTTDRGFTMARVLPAPRAAVWAAWTEPERLRWFAGVEPGADFEPSVDLRVGGAWRVHLYQPDGADGTVMTTSFAFVDTMPDADVAKWFDLGIRAGWSDTIDRLAPALA